MQILKKKYLHFKIKNTFNFLKCMSFVATRCLSWTKRPNGTQRDHKPLKIIYQQPYFPSVRISDLKSTNFWQSDTLSIQRKDFFLNYLFVNSALIVPTPLEGGGTIYSKGFFVQTALADRYTHRSDLRLVSLESLSSIENGSKRFFYFRFLKGVIEV